jgi:purine nucleosidase
MAAAQTLLILDVDTGIDDALGLLYACAAPEATILGVSTVAGNVDIKRATRNTRAVLALAGRADIPAWPGCARPIMREPEDASAVHGGSGLGHAVLPEPPIVENAGNAIDEIVAAAKAHAGELVLVATGPLTNVAVALMREPELPQLLKRLVARFNQFERI